MTDLDAQQQEAGVPPFPMGNCGLGIGGQDPAAAAAAAATALAAALAADGGAAGAGAGPPAPPILQWKPSSQRRCQELLPGPHGTRSPLA
jgi:hypothetical protein